MLSRLLLALFLGATPADPGVAATSGLWTGTTTDLPLSPPTGALEAQMTGDVLSYYTLAMLAARDGNFRRSLPLLREARALSYRVLQNGPLPRRLALRHFIRAAYVEEQLSELTVVEEQIARPLDRADDKQILLQLRALLLHNLFLAVRTQLGQAPARLLSRAASAYELALADPGRARTQLQVEYAALLAERGNLREARALFNRLSDGELAPENMDLSVAYYFTAISDLGRAVTRLSDASRRDGWARGGAGRDGVSVRHQVYRMHDFDRLRDHPRFCELVTDPEEALLGLQDPPAASGRGAKAAPGSAVPAAPSQSVPPAPSPRP